jgi:hypothetical protein
VELPLLGPAPGVPAVVTIADEVDAQLKQKMLRFMASDAANSSTHTMNSSCFRN